MPGTARSSLAARQAELVRALVSGGAVPDGFPAGRVRATAAVLAGKRARSTARAWPELQRILGEAYGAAFARHAAATPDPGDALRDGLLFARSIERAPCTPDAVRLALLRARLRRGARVGWTLLRDPGRLLLGATLPVVGVRLVELKVRSARD